MQGLAPGGTTFVNAVYLDNTSLELYHGLLDKRPGATTMRIKCVAVELDLLIPKMPLSCRRSI